jgi:hypothetical protein
LADKLAPGPAHFDVAGKLPAGAVITESVVTLHVFAGMTVSPAPLSLLATWGEGTSNAGETGDKAFQPLPVMPRWFTATIAACPGTTG